MTITQTASQVSAKVHIKRDGAVAVVTIDNPPVNAGSLEVRQGLLDAIRAVIDDPQVSAAVIIGAGKTFVAGSDIREFGKPLQDPQLPAVIAAIEICPKPIVAAIHGACLGGGFELALGCDGRVAARGAIVGLPEVTLGMIPGAGGTQRVPRLAGIAASIQMICSGRRIDAEEALRTGLVDRIAESDLRAEAIAHALSLGARKRRLGDERVPDEDPTLIEDAARAALKAGRSRPQVVAAIDAIKSAATLPFVRALADEREVFQRLRMSNEAAALRHLFFAEREASKVSGLEGILARNVANVGVIGAGTMGAGIAACFVDAGLAVTLVDQDDAAVERGMQRLREIYDRSVGAGRLSAAERDRRLSRVTPSSELGSVANADLVVEAVFEDLDVKIDLFRRLEAILPPTAILASNTSYLDLDRIASTTTRPGNVVGLHFFSPANVMRLLEIVRGAQTAPDVLATALAVAKRIRKLAVVARVGEGFIGNRIYAAYRRQCEFMIEEGAWPEQIDAVLTGFGFAMGPFAVSDMSGLDIAWRMRQRLAGARDPRERYVKIADRLCESGRFGQKTGAGWYRYAPGSRQGSPDAEVHVLIEAASAEKAIVRRAFETGEIVERALLTIVNEAALLFEEGIAARASDIDLVLVHGYGFPNFEGGPLFRASRQERGLIDAQIDRIATLSGFGFRRGDVSALLEGLD